MAEINITAGCLPDNWITMPIGETNVRTKLKVTTELAKLFWANINILPSPGVEITSEGLDVETTVVTKFITDSNPAITEDQIKQLDQIVIQNVFNALFSDYLARLNMLSPKKKSDPGQDEGSEVKKN